MSVARPFSRVQATTTLVVGQSMLYRTPMVKLWMALEIGENDEFSSPRDR